MTTKTPPRVKKEKAVSVVEIEIEKPVEDIVPVDETMFDSFIEHQRKAITEAGKAISTLLPEEFKEHGQTAIKEVIEGYRKLFNATIDEIIAAMEKAKLHSTEKHENEAAEKLVE